MIKNLIQAVAIAAISLSALPAVAQTGQSSWNAKPKAGAPATVSSELPASVRQAAIATRSDKSGQIAGARIGKSAFYVVYMRTANGCGSGGCRAQVWTVNSKGPELRGTLPVSKLPIVQLPQNDGGMPRLGISSFDASKSVNTIVSVAFDGAKYSGVDWNAPLPANSGRPLLTEAMLRKF